MFKKTSKRCNAKHPSHGKQVRCEEKAGHDGDHFNSFYNRKWDNDGESKPPPENEKARTAYKHHAAEDGY